MVQQISHPSRFDIAEAAVDVPGSQQLPLTRNGRNGTLGKLGKPWYSFVEFEENDRLTDVLLYSRFLGLLNVERIKNS